MRVLIWLSFVASSIQVLCLNWHGAVKQANWMMYVMSLYEAIFFGTLAQS